MSITPHPNQGMATGEAAGETIARPKLSRRPASFSRPAPDTAPLATSALMPLEPLPLAAASAPVRPASPAAPTAWQEDARFGIAMLLLVALVNIALVYSLPLLPHTEATVQPSQVAAKAPSMPEAVGRGPDGVTLYSQPVEERRTWQQFDLRRTRTEQNTLSVSPSDFPAPTARALDRPIVED